MVVDVRDGLTAADEDVAHMLRRSHKPIILAVNKCDKVGDAPMEIDRKSTRLNSSHITRYRMPSSA